MADTFFGFETSINNESDGRMLSPDEVDGLETEEEYDALNDETFGTLEDLSLLDDWEQQHEQFAEIAESTRHSENLENSINKLVLDEFEDSIVTNRDSVWSYSVPSRNGEILSNAILSNLQNSSKAFVDSRNASRNHEATKSYKPFPPLMQASSTIGNQIPKNVCTVEELERGLLRNSSKGPPAHSSPLIQLAPTTAPPHQLPQPPFPHPLFPHPLPGRLPPGLPPVGLPPHLRHLHSVPTHPNFPPGLVRMMPPPHFMQGGPVPPPGLGYPGNPQFPMKHPFNFPPPPRNINAHNLPHKNNQHNHHMKNRSDVNHFRQRFDQLTPNNENKDEYAGLMINKEKQWLLNIQMLQLNTGTPYFDDYYYTIFKERKAKCNKENQPLLDRNQRYNRRSNDRQDNQNQLQPKVYTPLQFENSLGKLQCGSVTAPRKVIDMDVVTPDKDSENNMNTSSRDTRKIKQLLLELEGLYSLLLKAEDVRNPLYVSNLEKLCEIKQKQRLRELDSATTSEQKQEILKLLQQESVPVVENQNDYLTKVVGGFFQEDKFASYLAIRKGKILLLRILPYLTTEAFSSQLTDIWMKVLLSIPMVGRRDAIGDNSLPRFHPHFKRYIHSSKMADVLEIVASLAEVVKQENNRATPLGHQGKAPLHFIISNKLGVSALCTMLIRTEYLISVNSASAKQQQDWFNFVISWAEAVSLSNNIATPLEPVPLQVFNKHFTHFDALGADRKLLLEKWFVGAN